MLSSPAPLLLRRNITIWRNHDEACRSERRPAVSDEGMTVMEPYSCPREVNSLGFIAAALILTMIVAGVGANVL